MTALIGTVHKPQQPPIPEPEGWTVLMLDRTFKTSRPAWCTDYNALLDKSSAERLLMNLQREGYITRLVHIGSAPKVPVEAIRRALDSFDLHAAPTDYAYVEELRSWLSEQEKGGGE